jgi:hypothetical protein
MFQQLLAKCKFLESIIRNVIGYDDKDSNDLQEELTTALNEHENECEKITNIRVDPSHYWNTRFNVLDNDKDSDDDVYDEARMKVCNMYEVNKKRKEDIEKAILRAKSWIEVSNKKEKKQQSKEEKPRLLQEKKDKHELPLIDQTLKFMEYVFSKTAGTRVYPNKTWNDKWIEHYNNYNLYNIVNIHDNENDTCQLNKIFNEEESLRYQLYSRIICSCGLNELPYSDSNDYVYQNYFPYPNWEMNHAQKVFYKSFVSNVISKLVEIPTYVTREMMRKSINLFSSHAHYIYKKNGKEKPTIFNGFSHYYFDIDDIVYEGCICNVECENIDTCPTYTSLPNYDM